uniref:Uncharacterized protein n=1 Tax=uncultured Thiotrichaceae bacterium TaxID=298394 RepID=A0A6S6STJ5_9GAMM|nr:MAG: Unknown protein [uncultured Thiotrichaceae bacterium]
MNKKLALLLLFLCMPVQLWAEAVGEKVGLLKQVSYEQVNQRVHEHLKQKIKIENVQPYTANETHSHPAIWRCVKAVKHKHVGSRKHGHTYGCPNRIPIMPKVSAALRPAPVVQARCRQGGN